MSANGRVPVIECIQASVQFWRATVNEALGPAVLPAAAAVVFAVGAASGLPAMLLGFAGLLIAQSMYTAALLRRALGMDTKLRLQLGDDERRLIVANLGVGAIAFVIAFAGAVTVGVVVFVIDGSAIMAAQEAGGADVSITDEDMSPAGAAAVTFGMLAVMAALLYTMVRLALFAPATIAERRIVVWEAWPWTRGNAWGVFASVFLLVVSVLLITTMIEALISPVFGSLILVLKFAMAWINAVLAGVLVQGLTAYLYRGLRPGGPAPPAAVGTT